MTRPLRILLGCDTFHPDVNGAARFAERLGAGLVGRGHEVHVVAPSTGFGRSGTFTETIEGQPMTVHRWPSLRWTPHEWVRYTWPQVAQVLAPRTIAEVRPDVVHVQSHIMGGRYLIKAAHRQGLRLVATNHAMPENILDHTTLVGPLNQAFLKWAWHDIDVALSKADAVTTPTQRAADFLTANTSIQDVLPISCGIDTGRYLPDLAPRQETRLLFVGRLTREKRIDTILQALAQLPAEVRLDIAGDGDQRSQLRTLARQLGVADRVAFHGSVTDARLQQLYRDASVFVIASIAELQSIATLEALASALPVVAADAMALPHLVRDGENGWLFPPEDAAALADRVRRILALPHAERQAMQQAALQVVRTHSLDRTLDVFEALYRGEPVPDPE